MFVKLDGEENWINLDEAEQITKDHSGYQVYLNGDLEAASILVSQESHPKAYAIIDEKLNGKKEKALAKKK